MAVHRLQQPEWPVGEMRSAKSGSSAKHSLKKPKRSGFLYFFLSMAFSYNFNAFLLSISEQNFEAPSSSS